MSFFFRRYFQKKRSRTRARQKYLQMDADLVKKNGNKKILVVLHLFYPQSWKEIREYLMNLNVYNWDLIVTYPVELSAQEKMKQVLNRIKEFKPSVSLISCENKGYDIGPFLFALKQVEYHDYDIVFKVQSKGVFRRRIYIYKQLFKNRDWFLNLFEGILGPHNVHLVVDNLSNKPNYKIAAAENLFVRDPYYKVNLVNKRLTDLNLKLPKDYHFVAGSCFAVKPELLDTVVNLNLEPDDFRHIPASRGMTLAHALERVISTCAKNEFFGTNAVKRSSLRRKEESFYAKHSAEKLLRPYKINDEFFFQSFDNRMVTLKKKKIRLRDLGVISPITNKYQKIEDTAPYRYLLGDKEEYRKYCAYHLEHNLPVMTPERFDSLIETLTREGYDDSNPILVQEDNIILDGQHRSTILAKTNGLDSKIYVLEVVVINKKWILKKMIPNVMLEQYYKKKYQY